MKRIGQFNHLFLMTATLMTIGSCGQNNNKGGVSSEFSVSQSISPTRNLTADERAIATRVCYAYQSKSTSFRTQVYYGGSFTFNMASRTCDNANTNYAITGILTGAADNSFFYDTKTTKEFFPKVQSSQTGYLAQLCGKIVNNLPISNTAVVNNVTVQVSFFASSGLDTYMINYFSPQNKITSADTFKVRTQFNISSGQILGMDEIYTKQTVCADNTKFSQVTQTFANFTGP